MLLRLKINDHNPIPKSLLITNPDFVSSKTQSFSNAGLFSESIFGRMNPDIDDSLITNHEEPKGLDAVGFCQLNNYKILTAKSFYALASCITPNTLNSYLLYMNSDYYNTGVENKKMLNEFAFKGITSFYKNFHEIISFHLELEKERPIQNSEKIEFLTFALTGNNKDDYIFTDRIEIYSSKLRPAVFLRGDVVLNSINSVLNKIVSTTGLLNDFNKHEESPFLSERLLFSLQETVNTYFDRVIEMVFGKGGYIREKLLGKRLDFTMRAVITPSQHFEKMEQIELPYSGVMRLLKVHYMAYFTNVKGYSPSYVEDMFEDSVEFSSINYDRLMKIVKFITPENTNYLETLFSRNPVINLGSILYMEGHIKENDEKTISMSNLIHHLLGSDYDGDVLNVFLIQTLEHLRVFKQLKPSNFIQNLGKIDNLLSKDYVVGLNSVFI